MMRTSLWVILACMPVFAQNQNSQDRQSILAMAGSYVVDFHFHETVGFQAGYDLKPDKDAAALEQVFVVINEPNKIVLQHILQTSRGIVKHWRQDWQYEPEFLWEFQKDLTWKRRKLSTEESRGKWAQRVFQVDDSPRYEALGTWIHLANLSQWTSTPTRRPLPRREYTTRDDYNVMVAQNRHALTPTGWVHEQDNFKLQEDDQGSKIIAREFGLNRYDHTDPSKLEEATAWWQKNGPMWADIRAVWSEVYQGEQELTFAAEIEEKPLHRHLSRLTQEMTAGKQYESKNLRQLARDQIKRFITPDTSGHTAHVDMEE